MIGRICAKWLLLALCFGWIGGTARIALAKPTELVMWHAYRAEERRALEAVVE